ncbi:MAG TPA: hypothetical protein ENI25_00860 [Epsilonproteobacteria bacterium]|nr:hypothetical protein [Campylobacterota bacterium]
MKLASVITGIVLILYAIFALVQLWMTVVSWATFVKVSITAAVIVIATLGLAMLYREYIEEKSMKEDKYLD